MTNAIKWKSEETVTFGAVFENWSRLEKPTLVSELTRIKEAGFTTLFYSATVSPDFREIESKIDFDCFFECADGMGFEIRPLPEQTDFELTPSVFDSPGFSASIYSASRKLQDTRKESSFSLTETSEGFRRHCDRISLSFNPGRVTRLAMALLAAGIKSIGLFRWNPERTSPVAGEFEMLDMLGRVTSPGKTAGQISFAIRKYSAELGASKHAARVQILLPNPRKRPLNQWAIPESGVLKEKITGLGGVTGALMSRNLGWEFITEEQICQSNIVLAPAIYLPPETVYSTSLLKALSSYVGEGGRVVAEMPGCLTDENGERLDTRPGSLFEQLFGASIANLHEEWETPLNELGLPTGMPVAELAPTTGEARRHLSNRFPSVIENRVWGGSACLLAYPLSRRAEEIVDWRYRTRLLTCIDDPVKPPYHPEWQCLECLAFRRESDDADHYFLLNDHTFDTTATLYFNRTYSSALNAISDEALPLDRRALKTLVPARSGVWVRLDKSEVVAEEELPEETSEEYDLYEQESGFESQQNSGDDESAAEQDVQPRFFMEDDDAEDHSEDEAEFVYRGDFSDWPEL